MSTQIFQWIGSGTPGNKRKPKQIHYKSFSHGSLKIEVGDFVLVRNDESMDPEDVMDCYVARVKDLYDTGDESESFQASVQWYSRMYEIPPHHLKNLKNINLDYEVVEEHRRQWDTEIDAETIFNKCKVIILPEDADFEECKTPYENGCPVFYCRYRFKGNKFYLQTKADVEKSINHFKNGCGTDPVKEKSILKRSTSPVIPFQCDSSQLQLIYPQDSEFPQSPAKSLKVRLKRMDTEALLNNYSCFQLIQSEPSSPSVGNITSNLRHKFSLNCKNDADNLATPKRPRRSASARTPKSTNSKLEQTYSSTVDKIASNLKQKLALKCTSDGSDLDFIKSTRKSPSVRTPRSANSKQKKSFLSDKKAEVGQSPRRSSSRKSVRSRNATPEHSPSKIKRSARRGLNFTEAETVTASPVTRSGRKIKIVNPVFNADSDDDFEPVKPRPVKTTIKTQRKLHFYNSDASDSGSEYKGSGRSSSESDDLQKHSEKKRSKSIPRSRRKSTSKSTPSTKKSFTPLTIPERKTPLKTPQSVLEESRQKLHVSAVPTSLPCREEEYSDIYNFVKNCLCAHTGGCMYISGVPGTGKTATVHEVMRNLEQEKINEEVPLFNFVEVNGMWMTDPYQCYVQIFKSLNGKTIQPQQAANLLEKRFSEPGPKKEAVVVLVDELDRLWTRKQTVMYNIFDWPTKKHSKLVVLAIANTMDLPERLMMNRISSRLGLTRKIFQPYTFRQLQEIVMCRIQELKVFDPDAVQLVARKVAAVSGDARRALDICRFAAEVAGQSSVQTSTKKSSVRATPRKGSSKILVTMEHVDAALQQMFSSPIILAIKALSKLEKIFLESVLAEFSRTGYEETTFSKVYQQLVDRCGFDGIPAPNTSSVSKLCARLASSHLIIVDNYQNDLHMKIRLNVSADDVNYALTGR